MTMRKLLLFACLSVCMGIDAQSEITFTAPALKDSADFDTDFDDSRDLTLERQTVYDVVEQMPSFPGGNAELMNFLYKNIHYPANAVDGKIQGRVVVAFIVRADGKVCNPYVERSVESSLDREALRIVKSMPRWTPGRQNGKAVNVRYNVPVSFRLR